MFPPPIGLEIQYLCENHATQILNTYKKNSPQPSAQNIIVEIYPWCQVKDCLAGLVVAKL